MSEIAVVSEIQHVIGESTRNVYMGRSDNAEKEVLTYKITSDEIKREKIEFSYGLLKIFDEIIVNAVDNLSAERKSKEYSTTTTIIVEISNKSIAVENDGQTIPIEQFTMKPRDEGESDLVYNERLATESKLVGKYKPEIVFTHFRTSANYISNGKRTTGGVNGIGAKMTCAFSKTFTIEVWGKGQYYSQIIRSNCRDISPPIIDNRETHTSSGVRITFEPDWSVLDLSGKFKEITQEQIRLLSMRVFDLCHLPVKLILNGIELKRLTFDEFSKRIDENIAKAPIAYISNNIAFAYVPSKGRQRSYVNNVVTYDGGSHINTLISKVLTEVNKKLTNKIESRTLKSKLSIVMYLTIPGASFQSQSKDKLVNKSISIKLDSRLLSTFLTESGIIEDLSGKVLKVEKAKVTRSLITNISKLVEAELAPIPKSKRPGKRDCYLFVCEGDSAQTLCVRGIRTIGSKTYGTFALRGKVLNTRKNTADKYQQNKELTNLKRIIGLADGQTYTSTDSLRYQHIICAKDADYDGAVIMGLVINFFHNRFPSLLKINGFISELITPINVLYEKPKDPAFSNPSLVFYSSRKFEKWCESNSLSRYHCKYVKGLGGNTNADVDFYFDEFDKHLVNIDFTSDDVDDKMSLAFAGTTKQFTDRRKEWIGKANKDDYLEEEAGLGLEFTDFIDRILVFSSNDACLRSIPSIIDGLKPSQRKVLYTFFGMSKTKAYESKLIYQLTGTVADFAMYHHGDKSMSDTITRMCQSFIGSNNIPLLQGYGQVGSRRANGDDMAQPRYVSASLAKITRLIFPEIDDRLLSRVLEDGKPAEPNYYIPIVPIVLVNGARGIGTGWNTRIPLFNPKDLITIIAKRLSGLDGDINSISPWYNGYEGDIIEYDNKWEFRMSISKIDDRTYRITELPVGVSIVNAESVINSLIEQGVIQTYESQLNKRSTRDIDTIITFTNPLEMSDVIEYFKPIYSTTCSKNSMVGFDSNGFIRKFEDIKSIFDEWYQQRLELYIKRKELILEDLELELLILENKYRFIESDYDLRKFKSKDEIDSMLEKNEYDRVDNSYEYLWKMPYIMSSQKKLEKLSLKISNLKKQIEEVAKTKVEVMWMKELIALNKAL